MERKRMRERPRKIQRPGKSGTEIKKEMETYRNGDPERQESEDIMEREEEERKGQKSFYDIHVHIKPRATLKVHCW